MPQGAVMFMRHLPPLMWLLTLVVLGPSQDATGAAPHPGRSVYSSACAHCHGQEGEGWPEKNGPTLRGTDWVTGDVDRLIKVTLGGLYLRIPLKNGTHYGAMVGVKDTLADEQVANVLTYIRQAWGNQAGSILPDRVATLRPIVNKRSRPFTSADFGLKPEPKLGPAGEALEPPDPFAAAGFKVYQATCLNCHQANGLGIVTPDGHGYPPLAGSEFVTGSPRRLIRIVLGGMQGPVVVKGKTFSEVMPPWHGALTDLQIAQVLTFARQAWNNLAPRISETMVHELRAESESREGVPWAQQELQHLDTRETAENLAKD